MLEILKESPAGDMLGWFGPFCSPDAVASWLRGKGVKKVDNGLWQDAEGNWYVYRVRKDGGWYAREIEGGRIPSARC